MKLFRINNQITRIDQKTIDLKTEVFIKFLKLKVNKLIGIKYSKDKYGGNQSHIHCPLQVDR